jgi:hypothetical protein
MTTVHNDNAACCSIPPVHSDYTPKGKIIPYGGIEKVYVTGSKSEKALVCVYDIFGYVLRLRVGARMC